MEDEVDHLMFLDMTDQECVAFRIFSNSAMNIVFSWIVNIIIV